MKKLFAFTLSILLCAVAIAPLAITAQTPPELGAYIQQEFEKTHMPGMSVEIVSADEVLFAETYGNCPSLDAPFVIGSISKSFTAVGIMQLVEQGKVDLSAPVATYLPGTGETRNTTVQQLLNQTSGIKTYSTLENYTTAGTLAPYEYANVNYALLGQIIENVSGTSYAAYINTHIFGPLGMRHSFTSYETARQGGLVAGHQNYFGLMAKADLPYSGDIRTGWLTLPAAYLACGTNDMGRYLQTFLGNTGGILTQNSVNTMLNTTTPVAEGYEYGMGLGLDSRSGELMVVHGGNVENYTTYMVIMPQRNLAAIVMFNACDFFVANELAIQLSYNVVNKYLGLPTDDIGASTYFTSHLLVDGILLAALALCVLPLALLPRWVRKKKTGAAKQTMVAALLLHLVLPTSLLLLFPLLGVPLAVVHGFAPDVFAILLAGSAALYITGGVKLIYTLRSARSKRPS